MIYVAMLVTSLLVGVAFVETDYDRNRSDFLMETLFIFSKFEMCKEHSK